MFSSIYITINICTPSSPLLLRKCIVCTNIAETSITVDNVRFVVDSGYVKQKTYDPNRHMESLVVVPISRVAAQQRAGCTTVLFCFLLYYPRVTLYGVVSRYPLSNFYFLLDFANKRSTLTIIIFLVISLSPLVLSPNPSCYHLRPCRAYIRWSMLSSLLLGLLAGSTRHLLPLHTIL